MKVNGWLEQANLHYSTHNFALTEAAEQVIEAARDAARGLDDSRPQSLRRPRTAQPAA
jgi:hypothetical protein